MIVCCSRDAISKYNGKNQDNVVLLPCDVTEDGTLDISSVLSKLKELDIKSLMVEGGAKVLTAFANHDAVDCLCVTISAKLLGDQGLPAFAVHHKSSPPCVDLGSPRFFQLGKDCVLLSKWLA